MFLNGRLAMPFLRREDVRHATLFRVDGVGLTGMARRRLEEVSSKKSYSLECSKEEYAFANAKSLECAASCVLDDLVPASAYQHYGQFDRILSKIIQKRWFLTKCNSTSLNDLKEPEKYAGNSNILSRTYITCFGRCLAEDAAMWGLYGKNNPMSLRVTIPGKVMVDWMESIEFKRPVNGNMNAQRVLKAMKAQGEDDKVLKLGNVQSAVFRDVIYAAVDEEKEHDEYDIRRQSVVSWYKARYNLKDGECVTNGLYAGFVKDCEWAHERESRLCVCMKKEIPDKFISIDVPLEVIEQMRFTFSPWLDRDKEKCMKEMITMALKSVGVDVDKPKFQRFRRSVLHGALNFS